MGCCWSNEYHDDEKGFDDKQFKYLIYTDQPENEYRQLETENDQRGDTAVEHIFRKTKMVYGQPPKDLRHVTINWKEDYGFELSRRPCPYDYPAFAGERPVNFAGEYDEVDEGGGVPSAGLSPDPKLRPRRSPRARSRSNTNSGLDAVPSDDRRPSRSRKDSDAALTASPVNAKKAADDSPDGKGTPNKAQPDGTPVKEAPDADGTPVKEAPDKETPNKKAAETTGKTGRRVESDTDCSLMVETPKKNPSRPATTGSASTTAQGFSAKKDPKALEADDDCSLDK